MSDFLIFIILIWMILINFQNVPKLLGEFYVYFIFCNFMNKSLFAQVTYSPPEILNNDLYFKLALVFNAN